MNKPPLPVRDGVNPTRLRLPAECPEHPTLGAYLRQRFPHLDPAALAERFAAGEVVDGEGRPLAEHTPIGSVAACWYYRTVPQETPLPVQERILSEDEHLVVVDKPHFLPTTPGGRYVQESVLVRLRRALDCPDLIPIHRLDRATAGVLLLSKNPATRGAYQQLFERQQVTKSYLAAAEIGARDWLGPVLVRNHITKVKGVLCSQVTPRPHRQPPANALSRVELVHRRRPVGVFALHPMTGKTHQLRIHMAALGLPILGDRFYPELQDEAPDDFAHPLQLLAHRIEFTDPLSGADRSFSSTQVLHYQGEPLW